MLWSPERDKQIPFLMLFGIMAVLNFRFGTKRYMDRIADRLRFERGEAFMLEASITEMEAVVIIVNLIAFLVFYHVVAKKSVDGRESG